MKLLYLLALIPFSLSAQQLQPVTSVQPDCGKFSSPIRIAGTVTTATIDNRLAACDGFVVTYSSNGFATVSVLLQSAPLGTGGIAGTFVSFAGTITAGFTNPATAITQGEIRATGYFPYVNVQVTTTGAGYLQVEFHGFKTNPNSGSSSGGSGCPGTVGTPCVVVGPTASGSPVATSPVLIAGTDGTNVQTILTDSNGQVREIPSSISQAMTDGRTNSVHLPADINPSPFTYTSYPFAFNGSTWDRQFLCTNQTPVITLTDGTRTQLIAASGSTSIRICHIHATTSAAEEFTVSTGTGSACGTGTAVIDDFLATQSFVMDYGPSAALRGAASQAVCITQSAVQSAKVVAIYAQF